MQSDHVIFDRTTQLSVMYNTILTIALKYDCSSETLEQINYFLDIISEIENEIKSNKNIRPNYIKTLADVLFTTLEDSNNIFSHLRKNTVDLLFEGDDQKKLVESKIVKNHGLINSFENLKFTIDFFKKLNYLSSNIVAIGANGSGKSSLAENIKKSIGASSVIISGQKILIMPNFESIVDLEKTKIELEKHQKGIYNLKSENSINLELNNSSKSLEILLRYLLAENYDVMHKYTSSLKENISLFNSPTETILDKVFNIWNELLPHRKIKNNGMNVVLECSDTKEDYHSNYMSDGEKVIFFYTSFIVNAPKDSFIIIDEPEMFLNKNILYKLWDRLENERQDCIFMYLTHDIDFASSRYDARKIWIKSYKNPNTWEMETIQENEEIPESLILELVGSRKNILFCEGNLDSSLDFSIYNTLFKNLTIKPVGSCENVIKLTKAVNKSNYFTMSAMGIVDADHMPEDRRYSLEQNNIFPLKLSEIENLLLDEDFIIEYLNHINYSDSKTIVSDIKKLILNNLKSEKELQVSNFISAAVDYHFKATNFVKGNNFKEVENNFIKFHSSLDLKEIYDNRMEQIDQIISEDNYSSAIKVFNNKGLKAHVNKKLRINNYTSEAISFLKTSIKAQNILKKYFHTTITDA